MMGGKPITSGAVFEVEYPFVRDTYDAWDADSEGISFYKAPTWRPGTDSEMCAPDDAEAVADGIGRAVYTVVSVAELPKPYRARIFFVREWINPDGKRFGKKQLRVMGIAAFRRRINGYFFEYRMRQRDAA